jgi:3-methyladenine DNA glycosylase AlkD
MKATDVKQELEALSHPEKREVYQRFFKTGKGEYGEGDIFLGNTMPDIRSVARHYKALPFSQIQQLLNSKIHEHRMCGLVILTYQYADAEKLIEKGTWAERRPAESLQKEIYEFYMHNLKAVNNWDLVDVTVPRIVGNYLYKNPSKKKILSKLVKSKILWERRIAVLATSYFISKGEFEDIIAFCEQLLDDEHDLMHKACGWMLREVGKRGPAGERVLKGFLAAHVTQMPRTMLRYSIERLPENERQAWLRK